MESTEICEMIARYHGGKFRFAEFTEITKNDECFVSYSAEVLDREGRLLYFGELSPGKQTAADAMVEKYLRHTISYEGEMPLSISAPRKSVMDFAKRMIWADSAEELGVRLAAAVNSMPG